ncbi:MAG: ferredoxin-thioredoxin reductase variable chain [Cyanobacteria bacterium J06635_15]
MLSQATVIAQENIAQETELKTPMKVGDRVRISAPVTLYHYPLSRNQPHNAQGMEGTIVNILTDWKGRAISPNFPVIVEFDVEGAKRPFKAHLTEAELEVI